MLDSPYQLVRRVSSINNLVSDLRLHLIPNLFAGWPQAPGEYRQAAHFEGDEMETFRCICTCFGWTCFFVCIHRRHHSFHHLCDGVNVWDAQIIFFSCLEHVHLTLTRSYKRCWWSHVVRRWYRLCQQPEIRWFQKPKHLLMAWTFVGFGCQKRHWITNQKKHTPPDISLEAVQLMAKDWRRVDFNEVRIELSNHVWPGYLIK